MAEARRLIPIPADWILKRIQKGKRVRLKNAQIYGNVDLSKLDLPTKSIDRTDYQRNILKLTTECKIISSPIEISGSEFTNVNFSNCLFDANAEFEEAIFGGFDFEGAIFNGDARFKGATFSWGAWYRGATFNRDAIFHEAAFDFGASFEGATFNDGADFCGATIQSAFNGTPIIEAQGAIFKGATFNGYAFFIGASFDEGSRFDRATFNKGVSFRKATFEWDVSFEGATITDASFAMVTFEGSAKLEHVTFSEDAGFEMASFKRDARFDRATFKEHVWFGGATFSSYAGFEGTTFNSIAGFVGVKFEGEGLTFRDATFTHAQSQEEACRRAKNVLAKAGNREEEEYHFYREMEAKRKQKGIYDTSNSPSKTYPTLRAENLTVIWRLLWYDFIEHVFIQKMFGYGVHPKRLMISWAAIVLAFGMLYWYGKGIIGTQDWLDYFKVSFATAIAPGYIAAIINPGSGGYRLVPAYQFAAMMETIVGTFLWAGFIATFAKKYMR
jgi:uncharacterized protein YjbI with pentapeptide repeats